MRTASTSIALAIFFAAFGVVASAQETNGLRMGAEFSLPGLRNPLDVSSQHRATRGYTPAHLRARPTAQVRQVGVTAEPKPASQTVRQAQAYSELPPPSMDPGESIIGSSDSVIIDNTPIDIDFEITGDTIAHSGDACCSNACGNDSCGGCWDCCIQLPRICLPNLPRENLSFFAGVQGFKGPVNRGEDGSFGMHQGLNWGLPIPIGGGSMGAQLGFRTVQSNFHGTSFTSEERQQFYLTAGLFRRADCGIQFGGVIDFQHDDWYAQSDLAQFRGEISWVNGCASEIGFMLAAGGSDEAGTATLRNDQNAIFTVNESRNSTDYYAFFYRHRLDCGAGDWRAYAGFSENSDGLIGGDTNISLSNCWSLQTNYTYLIPEQNNASGGNLDEAWNVGITFVFHPWGGGRTTGNYYRPLFNVADNGSFLVDVQ